MSNSLSVPSVCSVVYNFPSNSKFGKNIPKSKIYDNASPSAKIKEMFVKQVDKITWSYKLSPETINLPAKNGVNEIQIFTIALKTEELKKEILQTIDKAIPSRILFIVTFKDKIKYTAAYKRSSEADKSKLVVSSYFETDWISNDAKVVILPVALDMQGLYQQLLKSIIPMPAREKESMDAFINRLGMVTQWEREIEKLNNKLKHTKQFNRKVEINTQLRKLKNQITEEK